MLTCCVRCDQQVGQERKARSTVNVVIVIILFQQQQQQQQQRWRWRCARVDIVLRAFTGRQNPSALSPTQNDCFIILLLFIVFVVVIILLVVSAPISDVRDDRFGGFQQ